MTGLIPNRLRLVTKKVCHEHIQATEERVQRESLIEWSKTPNDWNPPAPLPEEPKRRDPLISLLTP